MTRSDILIELEIRWDKMNDHQKREFARTLSRKIDNVYTIFCAIEKDGEKYSHFKPLAKLLRNAVEG